MTPKVIFIVAASCGILSCTTSADSDRPDADASGVYVREYAYDVSNPETGTKIGMRQVRDSILIEQTDDGYQVSNRKWWMNDYDQEGWVSMAHSHDRPLPTFSAVYDENTGFLKPEKGRLSHPITINIKSKTLYKDKTMQHGYQKVD